MISRINKGNAFMPLNYPEYKIIISKISQPRFQLIASEIHGFFYELITKTIILDLFNWETHDSFYFDVFSVAKLTFIFHSKSLLGEL